MGNLHARQSELKEPNMMGKERSYQWGEDMKRLFKETEAVWLNSQNWEKAGFKTGKFPHQIPSHLRKLPGETVSACYSQNICRVQLMLPSSCQGKGSFCLFCKQSHNLRGSESKTPAFNPMRQNHRSLKCTLREARALQTSQPGNIEEQVWRRQQWSSTWAV